MQIGKSVNFDKLIRKLFRSMRFDYEIEVDEVLLMVLDKLFGIKTTSSGLFNNQNYGRSSVVSKETARIVCEDLLLSGQNPREFENILAACDFPAWKKKQILSKSSSSYSTERSASYKIFNKYGWNKMDSGWSSIGL